MKVYCLVLDDKYYILSETEYTKLHGPTSDEVGIAELAELDNMSEVNAKCEENGWDLVEFFLVDDTEE
jgi:hypothetical protein